MRGERIEPIGSFGAWLQVWHFAVLGDGLIADFIDRNNGRKQLGASDAILDFLRR